MTPLKLLMTCTGTVAGHQAPPASLSLPYLFITLAVCGSVLALHRRDRRGMPGYSSTRGNNRASRAAARSASAPAAGDTSSQDTQRREDSQGAVPEKDIQNGWTPARGQHLSNQVMSCNMSCAGLHHAHPAARDVVFYSGMHPKHRGTQV
jgi:hypothetical protein